MRATCPDCLARAQAEREAPPEAAALREADALWIAKANRVMAWIGRAFVCALVLFAVWVWRAENARAVDRARAKATATAAKHRTHAPEMAPMEGP